MLYYLNANAVANKSNENNVHEQLRLWVGGSG